MSRVLISAAHKSSGKTTISIGLCAAIVARNIKVQAFKKGPDYIDPMWLGRASQSSCLNLDFYTMQQDEIVANIVQVMNPADIAIIEGNKGLYDGLDPEGSDSNAALAKLTHTPVILVIDSKGITRGIAPLVLGYQSFDPDIEIAGVILNRVGGKRHEEKLRAVMTRYTDIPVLGAVYNDPELEISERHLGLVPSNEAHEVIAKIHYIAEKISTQVDLDAIIEIAQKASPLPAPCWKSPPAFKLSPPLKIGVIQDAAFGFYYPDDLETFRQAGAEIIAINALTDNKLPEIDALFIGGGFPEVYMEALASNQSIRSAVYQALDAGMPCYAECGGLIYLTRSLEWQGKKADMVGIIPADTIMNNIPQGRGYIQLQATQQHPWGIQDNNIINAHEFHYSSLKNIDETLDYAYQIKRGHGINGRQDGIIYKNTLACYAHQRNTSNNPWIEKFLRFVVG
ncbi:MAG: hydrogenobyrinic acid a,c-diamide synthase (glutamine-hydrolyzing) [Gammaproteobacteria bacterium]|nr:hydrogenobyrinic acid a,c-diamide synthase (glutamine-hydrolyzing) [Gammaproteobacteria bacterium]